MSAQFELDLPPTADAPRRARRRLLDWLGSAVSVPELKRAALLTSELVTNALMHGQGKISVRAQLDQDRLLVEVIDQGHGFERTVTEHDFEDVGGHGLRIVEAEASRWGIHEGTTHVWFELERTGPRLGSDKKPAH
ncbi:MAG TPA: ATP-binding protein [Solirubrobacteraceae bacterium]|nr:ATP-binding protein [Solirubrobacteraceae bacterium]